MTLKPLDKTILRLAIPAIVSNISVPLLGLSDTAISGHLGSEMFLAAMAVGATMLNLSAWLFGFLRMGTAGLSATAFGSSRPTASSRVFCRSLGLALLVGLLLISFRHPLSQLLVGILAPGNGVDSLASEYYRLVIISAPAQLGIMAMSGWMVGMQSTFWPMVVAISTNAINIPLSIWLAFGTGMGFRGLALGTCVAQWCGFLLALFCCWLLWRHSWGIPNGESGRCPSLLMGLRGVFKRDGESNFLKVNSALFFRSACVMAVSMGMTAYAGRLGELQLAVNAVLMQFFTFFSFFMDGFAHAAEAIIGRSAGAGDGRRGIGRASLALLKWSGIMALLFLTVYLFCGEGIVSLLTDSPKVERAASGFRWVMALLPPLSVAAFIFDGFYVGLTRTQWMLAATATATALFFLLNQLWPNAATGSTLWTAFLGYLLVRGLFLAAAYPKQLRSLPSVPTSKTDKHSPCSDS